MNEKVDSGIMLILLLIGMLTLTFNIQPIRGNCITSNNDVGICLSDRSCRNSMTENSIAGILESAPPDLTVFDPEIDELYVWINGVVFPGTEGEFITRIHWDWDDGWDEDHWFPASHTYSSGGDYTITVTAYQSDGLNSTKTKSVSLYACIYIRADGSVEPDTAPISSVDNITYTFFDNIYDPIVVERDNIVVDGAGCTLQGEEVYSSVGITLTNRNNVTIKNVEIKAFYFGIRFEYSSNNTIYGNSIVENNWDGVWYRYAFNNTISENNIKNNRFGLYSDYSTHNSILGNNITENSWNGVWLRYSSNYNTVYGNNINGNNVYGIELFASSNYNTIFRNNISGNNQGGILLGITEGNGVSGNNIKDNKYGIRLYPGSNHHSISRNDIKNNEYGIRLEGSSNNKVYHNNFIDNAPQVYSYLSSDVWDDGYPSGGNYWSDHVRVDDCCGVNQDEPGSDGIVDEPYIIDGYNRDNYPLVEP